MSLRKESRELVRKIERQGWRVVDRGNVWMCYSPDGVTIVPLHKTPSDRRALRNAISHLRRGGFDPNA